MDVGQDPDQCGAWNDLQTVLAGIFDKTGMGANYASGLGESLKKAGLQNVTVEKIQLPAGKRLGNETDAHNSVMPFRITIPTLIQASQGTPRTIHDPYDGGRTNEMVGLGLEIPPSVFDRLEERFEQEMMEQGGAFHCYVVWGQKA